MATRAEKICALIPARSGSKRVLRKNLAPCGGRPLIEWTADAALAAKSISRVIVSTDDAEIADVAGSLGLEVPFVRPPELSGDSVPMLPVMQHALAHLRETGWAADVIVLLQPSSPLRTAEDIDSAVDLLVRGKAETVVSVVRVPHQFHPFKVLQATKEGLRPLLADAPRPGTSPVPLPDVFGRNGPAVLATRAQVLDRGELYGEPCLPFVMPHERSIDIDEPFDLLLADCVLRRREGGRPI